MNVIRQYVQSRVERLARIRPDAEDLRQHGYAYSNVAEWFAAHGEEMPPGMGTWTEDEIAIIKNLSERVHLRSGYCFVNAQKMVFAAIASSRLQLDEDLAYAEGYAWIAGQPAPFAHGWCMLNNKVWDPSLEEGTARRVSYFGRTFPTKYLVERIFHGGRFGPLVNDWKQQWPLLKQRWDVPATLIREPALT